MMSNEAAASTSDGAMTTFTRFKELPLELQAYTFSFLSAPVLVRDVARTCRHFKRLVDAYVYRRLNSSLCKYGSKSEDNYASSSSMDEPCVLVFQAQRPIDTLTSRHKLFYSHVEYSRLDEDDVEDDMSTLQVHFNFVKANDEDMSASIMSTGSSTVLAQPNAHDAYDGPSSSSYVQGRRGRRRTNTRLGARPWALWSEPVTSSLTALERGRPRDVRSNSRDTSSRDASLARMDIHYGLSTGGRAGVQHPSSRHSNVQRPPTYRFQLDALDSFETWILSLSVQRFWWPGLPAAAHPSLPSIRGPMSWEKRVVTGLDRVFRDWFKPTPGDDQESLDEACKAPCSPQTESDMPSWVANIPDERELELDSESCIVRIQPHINHKAEAHPALVSMASHYYLSNTNSPYVAAANNAAMPAPSSYVDFTFHCTALRVNAGRLLTVIEDMNDDIVRTRQTIETAKRNPPVSALAHSMASGEQLQRVSETTAE